MGKGVEHTSIVLIKGNPEDSTTETLLNLIPLKEIQIQRAKLGKVHAHFW